jgi:hypothetical protein
VGRSKKSKAGSRMEALAEAVNALSARPLELVIGLPGSLPEGTRLERRLLNTVLATDKTTVIKVYREEPSCPTQRLLRRPVRMGTLIRLAGDGGAAVAGQPDNRPIDRAIQLTTVAVLGVEGVQLGQ